MVVESLSTHNDLVSMRPNASRLKGALAGASASPVLLSTTISKGVVCNRKLSSHAHAHLSSLLSTGQLESCGGLRASYHVLVRELYAARLPLNPFFGPWYSAQIIRTAALSPTP